MFSLARLPARIRQAPGLVSEPMRPVGGGIVGAPEETMKFMLTFSIKPEAKGRDEAIARFKATGGQPPKASSCLAAGQPRISAAASTFWTATTSRR
jgi:hypothetical protein